MSPRVYTTTPAIDRILAKIDVRDEGYESPCHVWVGAKGHNGYGIVTTGSHRDGSRKPARAHRVVWESVHGAVPDGFQIDHLCRTRACCNPAHLEAVTPGENLRRSAARKTHCPQNHPYAGDNLVINVNGARVCRTCARAAVRRSYLRRKARA